jgi:hypothetical protein
MGWASGSELMVEVIKALQKIEPSKTLRRRFYKHVILAFMDHDWDTTEECLNEDPAFDEALKAIWKKQGVEWEESQ